MQIILAERGVGKSTELIKQSAATGVYILVATRERARYLADMARNLELRIPFPVTIDEFFYSNGFRGSCIRRDGILIDDAEDVLQHFLAGISIRTMTITKREDTVELKHP